MTHSPAFKTSLAFLLSALALLFFADIEVTTLHPCGELGRMLLGLVTPDFLGIERLGQALLLTVGFALVGVTVGAAAGFGLSLLFRHRLVQWGCAFVRAIHELFWALLFLQFLGLNAVTGVLAIAVPFAGIFAKVYSEILEEADPTPLTALPAGTGTVSAYLFARLPEAWATMRSYTAYRLECGLRSSAVLGFVGLPTLGFQLASFFDQGDYSQAFALLLLFYLLIATLKVWARPRLLPFYVLLSLGVIWGPLHVSWANVARFFTQDIVPFPLRDAGLGQPGTLAALGGWASDLLIDKGLPGAVSTVVLAQIALVGTGLLALVAFPLVSRRFLGPVGRTLGHGFLVMVRTTPEYILAYIFLQAWGPSMLPAIVALALHNGAIIGHLTGHHVDQVALRVDAPRGLNLYAFEILPRVYGQFLAFLFYRWEVILRETAILGILGIKTLGFYVDSAMENLFLDRMVALLLLTALLNIAVDAFSRALRTRLRLSRVAEET